MRDVDHDRVLARQEMAATITELEKDRDRLEEMINRGIHVFSYHVFTDGKWAKQWGAGEVLESESLLVRNAKTPREALDQAIGRLREIYGDGKP